MRVQRCLVGAARLAPSTDREVTVGKHRQSTIWCQRRAAQTANSVSRYSWHDADFARDVGIMAGNDRTPRAVGEGAPTTGILVSNH
jgi:hypothetical protein